LAGISGIAGCRANSGTGGISGNPDSTPEGIRAKSAARCSIICRCASIACSMALFCCSAMASCCAEMACICCSAISGVMTGATGALYQAPADDAAAARAMSEAAWTSLDMEHTF
jgi:hypothetical protein